MVARHVLCCDRASNPNYQPLFPQPLRPASCRLFVTGSFSYKHSFFWTGRLFDDQEPEATRVDANAGSHLEDTRKKENTCHMASHGQRVASHGQRGISAILLGSETLKVLTHSAIPVIVRRRPSPATLRDLFAAS